MSAIFGEVLTFPQEKGPNVQLVVSGDEHYSRYETDDGYTAVYDSDLGLFCYATVVDGSFVSSGIPLSQPAPSSLRRHLMEAETVRQERYTRRRLFREPPPAPHAPSLTMRTLGPNNGLLEGRKVNSGQVRGLTVLVEFQDVTSTVTRSDVSEMLNAPNYTKNGNFCSARDYFLSISSGKLDYTNVVVGPFKLSKTRQFYTTNLLVKEAMDLTVAAGVDLTQFDSRHEGIIDAVNILYAGQTQYQGELWPHNHYIELQYGNMRTYFYLLTSMGRNSTELSIGTFCHENGHLLCRFPDMYDYGNRDGDGVESAGIGAYCLMGSGNHLNNGRTPSPVCGYLRDLAGWCDNRVVLNSAESQLQANHGDYGTVMIFETDKLNEYFIVENRSKAGLDTFLPSSGLAVYHCDTRGSNEFQEGSSTRHYQCALLQADGHLDLEHNVNQGDGTDLFAATAGTALSHATTPSARQWDGADSGLQLSNISAPGVAMTFTVGVVASSTAIRAEAAPGLAIPDNDANGVSHTLPIPDEGTIRSIKVAVDITHTYVGDLIVDLTSPSGMSATLHNRTGAGNDNLILTYDSSLPSLSPLIGQSIQGSWTLRARDVAGQVVGKLNRWSIEIERGTAIGGPVDVVARGEATPNVTIPDQNSAGISSMIAIDKAGTVRNLRVGVNITHTFVGDLKVELVSPTGRQAILQSRIGGSQRDLAINLDSASPSSPLAPLVGQPMQGTWILRVSDLALRDTGTLNKWTLELTTGASWAPAEARQASYGNVERAGRN